MPKLKRVKTDHPSESQIYEKAEEIARRQNIKIFKGSHESNKEYFKIFFFVKSLASAHNEQRSQTSPGSLLSGGFNRPNDKNLSKPDSEYLIVRIFPGAKRVQVEDSNVKKSLEARIGGDTDVQNQGNVMTLETQMKSLVAHWLELSKGPLQQA